MQHANRSALLVIDMQVGLFHGPDKPHDGQHVLDHVNRLIGKARRAGAPILAARHTGPQGSPIEAGSPYWQLLPELEIDAGKDILFDKMRPSCFLGTNLAATLASAGVGELVIVGMKTQYCIDTTCRVAAEQGLRVLLPADAHTCMDTPALPARAIIDHHNATLAGPFARVLKADAVVFA